MDPSSSPAAAKIQAQGKAALDDFANTFKTMRENADRTASVIEERLRAKKVDIPSTKKSGDRPSLDDPKLQK